MKQLEQVLKPVKQLSDAWFVSLAVLIGSIVRFVGMSKSSIWHDEGYTMMLSPQSPAHIIARTARDVHPPLYYLTLHYWLKMFGLSEIGARSLSAVLMLGVVIVGFLLVRELFGRPAARLSAVFLALGPFLVRYSQEARMYGMAAFLAILATYALVKATRSKTNGWWIVYSLSIAAGLYTHYYIVFIIALHWLYMLILKKPGWGLANKKWWVSNVASLGLFLFWVPTAYRQFTRVQAAFWIPKPTTLTLPSTIAQFLTFTDLGVAGNLIRVVVFLAFFGFVIWFVSKKKYYPNNVLIAGLTFLAPLLVLILSFKRPIYVDRYFVFAAAGFYMLLAILIYVMEPWQSRRWLRYLSIMTTVLVFTIGIRNVYTQGTHAMKQVGNYVNAGYQSGDAIISGELYTYFDFSYYNHTGYTAKLIAAGGMSGYGETSLLYDRPAIALHSFTDARPQSGYVWVIGKPGNNDDFKVPASWVLLDQFQAADSKVEHFRVPGQVTLVTGHGGPCDDQSYYTTHLSDCSIQ